AEILLGYEYSDLSGNTTDSAHALLTRTRLNYQTANFEGFDARIQAQYVGPINDHYRYNGGGNPNYDVVADPEAFRLHQAYLAYTGYDTHGRIGPQEIILDNSRFIGNVGWRFNAQSFNAGLVKNNSIEDLTLLYSYADSINTILGTIDHNRQYHMLNGEYKLGESNKASAFAYLQRNDNPGGLEKLDTYGGRFWGKGDAFAYDAMASLQRSAYYGYLKLNMDIKQVNVGVGSEYISGGGGNKNFQTLNGTAHKFNGWADQFLGTGGGLPSGLIDLWGEGSILIAEKLKLMGVYHFFNTAYNTPQTSFSGIYGHELDFMAKYPVCKNFDVLAKLAYYIEGDNDPGNPTNDETVFWLRGILRF
ncbi:MAG: alginate export family protein, partial [Verrucomicrobiota bacterium]|nr:alginate export family protein [Verrucomicrobiota bacterium]